MRETSVPVQKATVGPFLLRESIRYGAIREGVLGRCPRKEKESQENPAAVRAAIIAEGPGTGTTGMAWYDETRGRSIWSELVLEILGS